MTIFLAILQPVLSALFGGFNDWLERKRAEEAQRRLGASQVTSTINRESADAERRAAKVAANRGSVDDMLDDLAAGKF